MMKLNISASNVYICYCHNINSCCTFNSLMVLDMLLWYWASTQQHFDWPTTMVD